MHIPRNEFCAVYSSHQLTQLQCYLLIGLNLTQSIVGLILRSIFQTPQQSKQRVVDKWNYLIQTELRTQGWTLMPRNVHLPHQPLVAKRFNQIVECDSFPFSDIFAFRFQTDTAIITLDNSNFSSSRYHLLRLNSSHSCKVEIYIWEFYQSILEILTTQSVSQTLLDRCELAQYHH